MNLAFVSRKVSDKKNATRRESGNGKTRGDVITPVRNGGHICDCIERFSARATRTLNM